MLITILGTEQGSTKREPRQANILLVATKYSSGTVLQKLNILQNIGGFNHAVVTPVADKLNSPNQTIKLTTFFERITTTSL